MDNILLVGWGVTKSIWLIAWLALASFYDLEWYGQFLLPMPRMAWLVFIASAQNGMGGFGYLFYVAFMVSFYDLGL